MLSPGNPVGATVALTSNTSDTGGSGIASVTYELAPSGGSFNSQPASWDTTLVSDGLYDLRVIATDTAGNTTTSALITTRVDNTPPAVNFSSPATGAVVSGTVNLVGSSSDASPASPAVTFAYKLHSDPPTSYTATGSSWNTTTLPGGDGLYDLRARATDDASNTTSVENTSIQVDNAPPTISITAPAAAINGSVPSPTTFAANASDPAGSGVSQVQFFECSDASSNCATGVWNALGAVPAPGPYSVSWSIPVADGNHSLAAVATDNAGHTATAIRNVDVDRTAPNTNIVTKPADPSNDSVPSFTFSSTEPGSTFECSIDGGAFAPCTTPHTVPGLTDNDHTLEVRATDAAGNTDATPDTWTWHRDTNDPTGTINNPGANVRQILTLTSNENDPPANGYASGIASVAFEYSNDGSTWAPIGTNTSPPFNNVLWNTGSVADGVYHLRIVVSDAAGNSATFELAPTVRIDNTPPTTSQNDPGAYLRGTKIMTGSAADSGSGVDHVDFQRAPTGGGSWTTIDTDSTPGDGFQASFDTTGVSDGHYDFRTVAYDVAGNQAAATPVTDRLVDNTAPTASLDESRPVPARRRQPHLVDQRPRWLECLRCRDGRVRVLDERRLDLAVDRGQLQLGRGRRRKRRAPRRRDRRCRQHDGVRAGDQPGRQHEASHHGQCSERLAVEPGHRHAHGQRRRLQASTSRNTASTAVPATPWGRACRFRRLPTARMTGLTRSRTSRSTTPATSNRSRAPRC